MYFHRVGEADVLADGSTTAAERYGHRSNCGSLSKKMRIAARLNGWLIRSAVEILYSVTTAWRLHSVIGRLPT